LLIIKQQLKVNWIWYFLKPRNILRNKIEKDPNLLFFKFLKEKKY